MTQRYYRKGEAAPTNRGDCNHRRIERAKAVCALTCIDSSRESAGSENEAEHAADRPIVE